jgi:hypothetical protein
MAILGHRGTVAILAGSLLVALTTLTSGAAAAALSPRLNTTVGTAGCTGPGECIADVSFGSVPVGTHSGAQTFWLNNDYPTTATVDFSTGLYFSGPGTASEYSVVPSAGCPGASTGTITMTTGYSCLISVTFSPSAEGARSTQLVITPSVGAAGSVNLSGTGTPNVLSFGDTTLGTYSGPNTLTLQNDGSSADTVDLSSGDLSITGPGADDYAVTPSADCPGNGVNTIVLTAGATCTVNVYFFPSALGDRSAAMTINGSGNEISWAGSLSGAGTIGYYQVDSSGNVATAGDAGYYGDAGDMPLNKPIVGMAATGDDGGYWLVASDGGIFNYGDAAFFGSTGGIHLNKPIVGMAGTPDAGGYWLVASDGGIFSYGDAQFFGSTGSIHLNKPIVGMASTPSGQGYWLVASDGGIFSYGDAQFYGSTGSIHLAQPIVSMASMPTGGGYWFSAADGGLFNYGDAPFEGSGVGIGLGQVVDMASDGGPILQALVGFSTLRSGHVIGAGALVSHIPRFRGSGRRPSP